MQKLDRRQMISLSAKGAAGVALVGTLPALEGCNTQQWIQIVLADLPTILQIVTSILGIVSAAGVAVDPGTLLKVNKVGAEVKTDLQLAQTLVTAYQATPTPTILAKIDAALTTALTGLQSILTAFHVKDGTLQATISAALGAAITIVLAIQALIPPPPQAPTSRVSLKNPKDQSAVMKAAFNDIVGTNYPSAVI